MSAAAASLLAHNPSRLPSLHHPKPTLSNLTLPSAVITCGPRDNRGPLLRGRNLSTEAILAIQSLKRSRESSSQLSRLLKADLLAAAGELLRQDLPLLALRLLPIIRSEPNYSPNLFLSLYADIVNCLSRNADLENEADQFVKQIVGELEREGGVKGEDLRGPARLMKKLIAAERVEDVKMVYGLMKRGGCVPNEYLFKFLIRGLRRLGDEEGAKEVERDYEEWDVQGVWGQMEVEAAPV